MRWRIDPVQHERRLVTLLARLDEENRSILDLYIFPNIDRRRRFHVSLCDPWLNRGQPLTDLLAFCGVAASVRARRSLGSSGQIMGTKEY